MVGTAADVAFVVFLVAQFAGNSYVQADILCYACSSYMSQCQPDLLVSDVRNVFKARCSGKCFIRQGEDNATYRGCFDGFSSVVDLTDGYTGCRSQTWNNKRRQWCLCDTDLCNVHFDLQTSSHHQRSHPPAPPSVSRGKATPSPPSFGHQIPSKHPVRPSHDPRSDFFESFADKAKFRPSIPGPAPSDSLLFPADYTQQREEEEDFSPGRNNVTNYNREVRRFDHFKEQNDDRDVLIEEPIAFNHVQEKRHDTTTSHRPLPHPGQRKKNSDDSGPSKVIGQITYDADTMSFESIDYPYNQEIYRSISPSPSRPRVKSHSEATDDSTPVRKPDIVQADRPDGLLQDNDSTTRKATYETTDEGKELRTKGRTGLEKNSIDEELERAFSEDAVHPELTDDYPYNQIFNEELAKEDLQLLTEPRPFELRFSQTIGPSSESAEKSESSKSTLEVDNDIFKEQESDSRRPKESEVRAREFGRTESRSPNDLIRLGSLNDKQQKRPEPNQRNKLSGYDARERSAIHDGDILWVGQDRDTGHADPSHLRIPDNPIHEEKTLEGDSVDSDLERRTSFRQHTVLEKKSDEEGEGRKSGDETDIKEAHIFDQDEQEVKTLEKTGIDRRTGIREQGNEIEEFSSQTNPVEQTTLKTATTIRCFRTGYYDNPTDCTQFIACLLDPRSRAYILHFMRCPAGLSWDNARKLCMETSSTCFSPNQRNVASRIASPAFDGGIQLTQKHLLPLANDDSS